MSFLWLLLLSFLIKILNEPRNNEGCINNYFDKTRLEYFLAAN